VSIRALTLTTVTLTTLTCVLVLPATGALASPGGTVSTTVPETATPASDGLPRNLPAGSHHLSLPVWRAAGTSPTVLRLLVDGRPCASAPVRPGQVVRLTCEAAVSGKRTVVTVRAGRTQVARWVHGRS
jgi:hypothetical protein